MAVDTMQEIPKKGFTHNLQVIAAYEYPVCLIITSPLPAKPVDKVVFTFKSHDQGWSSSNNFDSIYDGSWTWFEAMILRPMGDGDDWSTFYWANRDLGSEPLVYRALAELAGLREPPPRKQATLFFVANPKDSFSCSRFNQCRSWIIQRNRRARSEPKEHTIIWDKSGKQSRTESVLGWNFDAETGASSGVGFVNCLREGDRIVVMACAEQSPFVNHAS